MQIFLEIALTYLKELLFNFKLIIILNQQVNFRLNFSLFLGIAP